MARTPLDEFHTRLRIMRSIDRHELIAAGAIDNSIAAWLRFDENPHDFFIRADDRTAQAIWSIIEARSSKRAA